MAGDFGRCGLASAEQIKPLQREEHFKCLSLHEEFFFFLRVVFAYLSACGQDIAKSTLEILVKCDGKARVAQKKKKCLIDYTTPHVRYHR